MISLRRILFLGAVLCALLRVNPAGAAQAFLVFDSKTGYVLQAQNSEEKRQVGSLTKIATAAVVLDWAEHKGGSVSQVVTIPPQAFQGVRQNPIGFQAGDRIEVRDLLYAALVQSDNIAANTLAAHVGSQLGSLAPEGGSKFGPVDTFVAQMNALARQLKMLKTRFVNPSGIDDNVKPMPFSTAADMARLARYAMNKASFRFYVSQKERAISFDAGGRKRNYMLRNTNELLGQDGIDGVKTGETAKAGPCLILSANREPLLVKQGEMTTVYPRHLIVVVLASPNRFAEGDGLVRSGWNLYDQWVAGGRLVQPEKLL